MKEITDQIEQGIQDLFNSEKYKKYLNTMSKFHDYSPNNIILIAMQNPDARYVAGYQSWKKNFERNVKKGEKGIRIIAPAPYQITVNQEVKDSQGNSVIGPNGKPETQEVKMKIPAYRIVTVFDVSQTDGKELPKIVHELSGNVKNYDLFMNAVKEISPVPIEYANISSGAKGYFSSANQKIVLKNGMSEMQTAKTMIHELAHSKLHDALNNPNISEKDRRTKEVEAESIAYTVCQYYGLDTSEYSFGYIATWSSDKELPELKKSLDTIRSTAANIINGIDEQLEVLQNNKESQIEKFSEDKSKKSSVLAQLAHNKDILKSVSKNETEKGKKLELERSCK